ncbi:beta-amyrin synthase 1-like [Ziziphus jujuba]|uniref:Beta-amyrin synthase 1-like n=1 Tax=Ziziphus jujuba TaxID=326968 RepID=A0ABM4A3N8_ZIZJJ|nr:beta-amyrin synthase 1-like [Ziziphus jujuba]
MWKIKFGGGEEDPYLFSTNNFLGRQIWEYDADAGSPEERDEVEKARQHFYQNRFNLKACSDLLWRFQLLGKKNFKQSIPQEKVEDDDKKISYKTADATMRRAINFWSALQSPHGHWPALNAGVMFFVPLFVFCMYITGTLHTVFNEHHRREMLWYLYCHQNEDGGWGLHIEGPSMMMCTVLNYLAMRILGEGPDGGLNNACSRARKWILDHGGAMYSASWGKTWMAILGAYDWEGSNPLPPEFWFYQTLVPFHPSKMMCYTRLTFMPMSYLYGKRFVGPITPLIQQLREEIYNQPYNQIKWAKVRHCCAKEDNYYPHGRLQRLMWDSFYYVAEPLLNSRLFKRIRESAVQKVLDHIHYEDENSRYITIACVEKPLMMYL